MKRERLLELAGIIKESWDDLDDVSDDAEFDQVRQAYRAVAKKYRIQNSDRFVKDMMKILQTYSLID